VRAATAENCIVETQRWASTRAVFTGLPASAAIVIVRSSSRSATSSAARSSIAARSCAGNPPASKAARAASTAFPTSAASPFGTRPITVPSYGAFTSDHSPVSTHLPAT
jgi:hypothetical protein